MPTYCDNTYQSTTLHASVLHEHEGTNVWRKCRVLFIKFEIRCKHLGPSFKFGLDY
jgi:hypothetical protein